MLDNYLVKLNNKYALNKEQFWSGGLNSLAQCRSTELPVSLCSAGPRVYDQEIRVFGLLPTTRNVLDKVWDGTAPTVSVSMATCWQSPLTSSFSESTCFLFVIQSICCFISFILNLIEMPHPLIPLSSPILHTDIASFFLHCTCSVSIFPNS